MLTNSLCCCWYWLPGEEKQCWQLDAPIAPLGTQHKLADSSIHDSDEADYPNADNEGSDLDTILPEVLVPMGDDCAAIDNGNSQLAGVTQHGVIESLKVKYQAYLNSGFGQATISKELMTKI